MNTNRRFLNYKKYDNFQRDLNDGKISEDSIVFIQDQNKRCIWARGVEYVGSVGNVDERQLNAKLKTLQEYFADQYVLKKDVQTPDANMWSEATIYPFGDTNPVIPDGNSGDTSGSSVRNNMVTLSARAYQLLVDANAVDPNTYYFTYEGDDIQSWTFGGTFPITFGSESTGTFPITLT